MCDLAHGPSVVVPGTGRPGAVVNQIHVEFRAPSSSGRSHVQSSRESSSGEPEAESATGYRLVETNASFSPSLSTRREARDYSCLSTDRTRQRHRIERLEAGERSSAGRPGFGTVSPISHSLIFLMLAKRNPTSRRPDRLPA